MKIANRWVASCLSIAVLVGLCGCGTFPMRGDTKRAIFTAYSGAELASGDMATIRLSRKEGVWVSQLDGRVVRFGPFPPMGAWEEIVFEIAPGAHELVLEPISSGAPAYNPNTGRYESDATPPRGRTSLAFSAAAGRSYAVKRFYIEDEATGKPVVE